MKRLVYTALYLCSLFFNWSSLQHRLFRWVLATGEAAERAAWLFRFIVRLRKQRRFIEHVARAPMLNETEKRKLKAQAWRHVRQYQKAWTELSSTPLGDEEIDELRVKTLYDLRRVDELLKIGDEIPLRSYLTVEQQRNLVGHAFRHHGPREARRLAEWFAAGEVDTFFAEAVGKYRDLEESAATWSQFVEGYGQQFDFSGENEEQVNAQLDAALAWLSRLPADEGELGLVLLLRYAAKKTPLYAYLVSRLHEGEGEQPQFERDRSSWALIGMAQKAVQEKRYQLALHFALDAYREGERSSLLYELLIESLSRVSLKRHLLLDMERLVDEGFLDLLGEDALRLLEHCPGFSHLYAHLDENRLDRENVERLLQAGQAIPGDEAQHFWHYLSAALLRSSAPLSLDNKWLNRLASSEGVDPLSLAYLRLRKAAEEDAARRGHASDFESASEGGSVSDGKSVHDDAALPEIDSILKSLSRDDRVKALLFLSNYHGEHLQMKQALIYAEKAHQLSPRNIIVLRRLIGLHHRLGNITERLHYLELFRSLSGRFLGREYDMARDEAHLLETKWEWQAEAAVRSGEPRADKRTGGAEFEEKHASGGILHVLNKSLPEINGYTVRSTEIVTHQHEHDLKPMVVTKLGWPPPATGPHPAEEMFHDIPHYRLYAPQEGLELNKVPMSDYFQAYADHLADLVERLAPRVIHAASNFQNALPSLQVAKKLAIPSVYEVRGMWQDTQSSKTPGFYMSERYRLHQDYEVYCCHLADRVVAISESLRQHLVELGIPESKIDVVPNGVDVSRFTPREKDIDLIEQYGLADQLVFGFIGSVTAYEGLDILLRSLALLKEKRSDFKCLIVGDGPVLNDLKQLANQLSLDEQVYFIGRVPHEEVQRYYSVIDVFPFPRTKAKVCELVTPLKPYEAMAMGKLVLVSDIPALREMVLEGETGLIFEAENEQALLAALEEAPHQLALGEKSRTWVEKHRAWQTLIHLYPAIYERAIEAAKTRV